MTCVAYTYVRNEQDIIRESLTHMLDQGLNVYVIDNWSTDDTRQIVTEMIYRHRGRLYLEKFPDQPPTFFSIRNLELRIQQLHHLLDPEWGLLFGADELFEAPHGLSVAEFLEGIGAKGYTCVGCVQATFTPVDDTWQPGMGIKAHFRYWHDKGRLHNVRAWKARKFQFVDGGHDVIFDGYKLYPDDRLILRHYLFRNQEQATHKVFVERKPRYSPEERAMGWHTHLDAMCPGHNFIMQPEGLHIYRDPKSFYQELRCLPTS